MEEPAFLQGFAELYAAGLSFDAWLYFDQLPELCALADRFADTPIIIDHYGSPVPHRRAPADRAELFAVWRRNLCEAARRPNVAIKLGGLGMPLMRLGFDAPGTTASSEQLAAAWQPYFEVALEAFGPARAMFESNYPADRPTADYPMLWNVAKRLAAGLSEGEKDALFSGTAQRIYRLDL
jgi:predicted TIM-barrel fold metal-dependent hydrolase